MNMTPNTLSPVPFHGSTLFVTEKDGEPFAPMRPIVEGMGLDWAAQFTKISANAERWSVANIATVAEDGKDREMVCMPVRKLPAWLSSINPKKVRPEIRETVVTYQNECDDALWNYWTKGEAKRGPQAKQPSGELPRWKDSRLSMPKRIAMFLDANPGEHHNAAIDEALGLTTSLEKRARTKAMSRLSKDGFVAPGLWPQEWRASSCRLSEGGRIHRNVSRNTGRCVTDSDIAVQFGQFSAAKASFMDAGCDLFGSIQRKARGSRYDYTNQDRSSTVHAVHATEAAFYALDRVMDCIESLTRSIESRA